MRCFTPSGDVWCYTYDAFGRRLSKTKVVDILKINESPAFPLSKQRITAWHYLWSGDQMVEEPPSTPMALSLTMPVYSGYTNRAR
ncbi:hypothetical protein AB6G15_13695 [Providencia manganoxydans]